jgi:CHAD domain-containing protein
MAIGIDPTGQIQAGSPSASTRGELVHETRKAIKRMRALARLLRYELGKDEFKRVNDSLRDAGRRLSETRDAEVRLATLRSLRSRHPKALALGPIDRLERRLEHEREHAEAPAPPREVLADIAAMRGDLARWNLVDPEFAVLAPGLERIYREGRRRYARVADDPGCDAEHLHDWRKRVKGLYYALDMLGAKEAAGTHSAARRAARRANRLGDVLGEEHDLWMLLAYLRRHPADSDEDAAAYTQLTECLQRRRRRLRKRALELGGRLYKRKPAPFTRRIARALSR